ncbi:hypothetical protein [Spiroplasma eriocheiris]|uniref:Uncharacterized protein n=1 Tax=Spiroplasma eriocheiris TaxID=315358 RepID=A0A0H3XHV3_9MOLU|nr:hypothetical protein [Spiroplasma eriocheiris]AHF57524.1 putative lipoprotein [Spiroplasma eriocheiris CCTCC M 207170]AKM53980.1 hypothetical protein SERIO_v1c04010 [Spiroplasma eriocheiris]
MRKLLALTTSITLITSSTMNIVSCNLDTALPFYNNDGMTKQNEEDINDAVLGGFDIPGKSKISSLFDYNLDKWAAEDVNNLNGNLLETNLNLNKISPSINAQHFSPKVSLTSNSLLYTAPNSRDYDDHKKDINKLIRESLLSSNDIMEQPTDKIVNKYESYLTDQEKADSIINMEKVVEYYEKIYNPETPSAQKKRWLYVDKLRGNYTNWFKQGRDWNSNPFLPDFDFKNVKYVQSVFYYTILEHFIQASGEKYNVNLTHIWGPHLSRSINSNIAQINFTFTAWDPLKWVKYYVDGHPIVDSNDNIFENMPIIPLDEKVGVKLIVTDIYGGSSSYIIGNFTFSKLLNL